MKTSLLGILLTAAPAVHAAQTMRAEVNAKSHVIAAGRHFAVEAGMRTFRQGGNAFDAGVAEERALQAVLPHLPRERVIELAQRCIELYVKDRLGSHN